MACTDVAEGMPVVCEANLKSRNMYNAQLFKVTAIDSDYVCIKNESFTHSEFANYFNLAFCMTVYKYQGGTIDEPYCIHNANAMDKKEFYTALSRTTKYEYLHVGKTASIYDVKERKVLEMLPLKTEYHTGKVYFICFVKEGIQQFYIGSTIGTLRERLAEHQSDPNSPVYQCTANINLLCNVPCKSKAELEAIENKYINMYPDCVNIRGRIKEEPCKQKRIPG